MLSAGILKHLEKNVSSLFYDSGIEHECLGFIWIYACLSGTQARPSPSLSATGLLVAHLSSPCML